MVRSSFESLISQKISFFLAGDNPVPESEYTIYKALNQIKNGKWKDEIEWYRQETDEVERDSIKLKFPAFTFSGTFSYRKASDIKSYTHVVIVDVDKKDMELSFEKTWKCITDAPFVFAAFESPSGGIKALAYSRIKLEKHRDLLYPCIEDYFMRNFGIKMDPKNKDVSRLCFISWDPNMYLSYESKRPFSPAEDSPEMHKALTDSFKEVVTIDYDKYQESTDVRHVFKKAREWAIKYTGGFHKGRRNNYVYYLSCILNRAGIYEATALDIIGRQYPSFSKTELKTTVHSAYFHHKNEFGIKPVLQYKKTDQKPII